MVGPNSLKHVIYYGPFQHYVFPDFIRLVIIVMAFALAGSLLAIAKIRWGQEKRSATMFLLALFFYNAVLAYGNAVAMGRPPTPALYFWPFGLLMTTIACYLVINENRRNVWFKS